MLKISIFFVLALVLNGFTMEQLLCKETNNKMIYKQNNGETYKFTYRGGNVIVQADVLHSPSLITLEVTNGIKITSNDGGKTWKVVKPSVDFKLKSEDIKSNINIYPVPSGGILNIDYKDIKVSYVQVLSLDGQMQTEIRGNNITKLDLSNLSNGAYILVFNSENYKFSELITINK